MLLNNGQPLVEVSQQAGQEDVLHLTDSPSVKVTSRTRYVSYIFLYAYILSAVLIKLLTIDFIHAMLF